jgi:Transposase DDE domain
MQSILTAKGVQVHAIGLLRCHLHLKDIVPCCPVTTLLSVLLYACSRMCSLFAACNLLRTAPSHESVRQALHHSLAELGLLERRLNNALAACISSNLRRHFRARGQRNRLRVAIDLHLRPYHGKPLQDDNELVRGQAKSGTTHFHAYATAYLILRGQRFTLALTYVRGGEKMEAVVKRLLQRCAQLRVKPGLVLLDRGFWSVAVIRYLQAAHYPFVMPVIARGKKADKPGGPTGTQVFQDWKKGGFSRYTLQQTGGKKAPKATVQIGVHVRNRNGRRDKHGRERLVYALWGWRPSSVRAMSEIYRERFGIETSYRQLGEAKVKTCTRSPAVRLFFVGVALLLRNVWVWLHHEVLSSPRRGKRKYNWARLRFRAMLAWLQREAETLFGVIEQVLTERLIPIGLLASDS